jgi:hypothetical protein
VSNVSSNKRYKLIGEYLIEAGLLTQAQVGVALTDQNTTTMMFGEIIATRGWVKPQTIEYLVKKIIEPERNSLRQTDLSFGMVRQPSPMSNQKPKDPDLGVNWIG